MVTTPTSGGPAAGGADFGLPQPASSRPAASSATATELTVLSIRCMGTASRGCMVSSILTRTALAALRLLRALPNRVPAGRDGSFHEWFVQTNEPEDVVATDVDQRPERQGEKDRQRQVLDHPAGPSLLEEVG